MEEQLPAQVVATDRRLDENATRASEDLAKHRWHWTLDESNPDRVSAYAYAKAVGRNEKTIRSQVSGYADYMGRDSGAGARTLNESIERAKMGAETAAATEAVAKAHGTEFGQARKARPTEVRRVREMARERAELNETTVEEEAPKVAEWIARSERAEQKRTDERKEKLGLRFVEMEGYLAAAKRKLTDALNLAHAVPWGDEERELLQDSVTNIQALLGLIDTALGGTADVNWDAELAKLTEVES